MVLTTLLLPFAKQRSSLHLLQPSSLPPTCPPAWPPACPCPPCPGPPPPSLPLSSFTLLIGWSSLTITLGREKLIAQQRFHTQSPFWRFTDLGLSYSSHINSTRMPTYPLLSGSPIRSRYEPTLYKEQKRPRVHLLWPHSCCRNNLLKRQWIWKPNLLE